MTFEFATAGRILFAGGGIRQLPSVVADLGSRALVVTGSTPSRWATAVAHLEAEGVAVTAFSIGAEPTVAMAEEGVAVARKAGCQVVVGLGGGSVLDGAKAIAALATNPGDPLDYLEVIGAGRALAEPPLPHVAVPTTAGTGSEVTRNAVLASPQHRVKVSLRSLMMLPTVALVDPELTWSMPPSVTASTGLDALTQVLEPFVSHQANPLSDALCRDGLKRAARSLARAYRDGRDAAAREDMALASLCGGLALANAKLGAVHGIAGPAGGMFEAPHGAVCARLLPFVMQANVKALEQRAPSSPALARYAEVASLLTGRADATPGDGIAWVADLAAELAVPGLGSWGLTAAEVPALVEKARAASSMKGNPLELTGEELTRVIEQAL